MVTRTLCAPTAPRSLVGSRTAGCQRVLSTTGEFVSDMLQPLMRRLHVVLLLLLVVGALAVRAERIASPLLDFHPTRQYRSAIITRGHGTHRE